MDQKDYDWQGHYESDDLGWDLGEVAPSFVKLWEEGKLPLGKVIIPGCGRGHEAIFLAEKGFDVTGIDLAEGAVTFLANTLKERNLAGRVLRQDFFSLDDSHNGVYDLALEHTFFCAIPPRQRQDYCLTVARLLKPGGVLAGLFYNTGEEGGPPYNTAREDIETIFSKTFEIQELYKSPWSTPQRKDKEWLGILQKR